MFAVLAQHCTLLRPNFSCSTHAALHSTEAHIGLQHCTLLRPILSCSNEATLPAHDAHIVLQFAGRIALCCGSYCPTVLRQPCTLMRPVLSCSSQTSLHSQEAYFVLQYSGSLALSEAHIVLQYLGSIALSGGPYFLAVLRQTCTLLRRIQSCSTHAAQDLDVVDCFSFCIFPATSSFTIYVRFVVSFKIPTKLGDNYKW